MEFWMETLCIWLCSSDFVTNQTTSDFMLMADRGPQRFLIFFRFLGRIVLPFCFYWAYFCTEIVCKQNFPFFTKCTKFYGIYFNRISIWSGPVEMEFHDFLKQKSLPLQYLIDRLLATLDQTVRGWRLMMAEPQNINVSDCPVQNSN